MSNLLRLLKNFIENGNGIFGKRWVYTLLILKDTLKALRILETIKKMFEIIFFDM